MCILMISCNVIPVLAEDTQTPDAAKTVFETKDPSTLSISVNEKGGTEEASRLEEKQAEDSGMEAEDVPVVDSEVPEEKQDSHNNIEESKNLDEIVNAEATEQGENTENSGQENSKAVNTINPPAPVTGLKAQNSGKYVYLKWNVSPEADGYIIYRQLGKGSFKYLYIVSKTDFTDLSASADEYNFYRVYPYKMDNNGNRVVGKSTTYVYSKATLPAVGNLKAKGTDSNTVTLSWSKVAGAEGYIIYRQIGTWKMEYRYIVSGTGFKDTTASNKDYNFYRVYPYFTDKSGKMVLGPSKEYVYARGQLDAVIQLRAVGKNGYVNLSWDWVWDADGYIIYRQVGNSGFKYRYITSNNTMQDTTASTEEFNFYRVYAYFNDGERRIIGKVGNYVYAKAIFQGQREYSEGIYHVGENIPAGNYVVTGNSCYIAICSSYPSDNSLYNIIENDFFSGNRYVTLHAGEYYKVERGKTVPLAVAPKYTGNSGKYGSGMYLVGRDLSPGRYLITITPGSYNGYYEIRGHAINGSEGSYISDIIKNEIIDSGSRYVTLENGQYIILERANAVKK